MALIPKNWSSFQHYKNRNPPWIKLHKTLLDDCDFQRLPDASRALAPMLWLLASETEEGIINLTSDQIAFRLRCDHKTLICALKPLIDIGLFVDASGVLAGCKQDATPEEEKETDKEGEKRQSKGPTAPRPLDEYASIWNGKLAGLGYGKMERATPKREKTLQERKKADPDFLETFTKAVAYLAEDTWWRSHAKQFTIDLLLQPDRAQTLSEKTPSKGESNGSKSPAHRASVDEAYKRQLAEREQRLQPKPELSDEELDEMFSVRERGISQGG